MQILFFKKNPEEQIKHYPFERNKLQLLTKLLLFEECRQIFLFGWGVGGSDERWNE